MTRSGRGYGGHVRSKVVSSLGLPGRAQVAPLITRNKLLDQL